MSDQENPSRHPLPGYQPGRDVVLDPRSLKALAHPIRLRLRAALVEHGPATATQLAMRIGESSGSTSYHVRQLAEHGLVAEATELSSGRERYWRAVHRFTWYQTSDDPATQAVGAEYVRAVAHTYADRLVRFANSIDAARDVLGAEWADAWDISDWLLDLTPEQARQLTSDVRALCLPYRHEPGASRPGSRVAHVQVQLLPAPAEPTPEPPESTTE